jgi:hypothetical protein
MYRISKKTHAVLILITILTLYSCNYIVNKNDEKEKSSKNSVERIKTSKEQAKLLVNTSKTVIEVIDICKIVENSELEESKRTIINNLKTKHIKILDEIKLASSAIMVSVPYNNGKSIQKLDDKLAFEEKIEMIQSKVIKQRELVNSLKKSSSNKIILELTDSIIPLIDTNLKSIHEIETKFLTI